MYMGGAATCLPSLPGCHHRTHAQADQLCPEPVIPACNAMPCDTTVISMTQFRQTLKRDCITCTVMTMLAGGFDNTTMTTSTSLVPELRDQLICSILSVP